MSDVMTDKDGICRGCQDEMQSYAVWPCTHCYRNLGETYPDKYKPEDTRNLSRQFKEAFKNV